MVSLVTNSFLEYTMELLCSIFIVEQIAFIRLSYQMNAVVFSLFLMSSARFLIYKNV